MTQQELMERGMPDPTDAFILSMSQLLLPTSYRAHVLAEMEVLRLARGYQVKMYEAPPVSGQIIPAFSQLEHQLSVDPGSYLWGWTFSVLSGSSGPFHILVTDACTETALSADYFVSQMLDCTAANRWPALIAHPRLISDPGQVNVEIYNGSNAAVICQLVLFTACPLGLKNQDARMLELSKGVY